MNAAHARHLEVRRLLLIGRLDEAERVLAKFDAALLPPPLRAAHELVVAGIAMRRLRMKTARAALAEAERAARLANIPALIAEVESTALVLNTPAARLIAPGEERLLLLDEVEALLTSGALVVDACRHVVRDADTVISLTTRPVLFALARALGEAWPADVARSALLARAFRAKHAVESHRARLRVEIGRLRVKLETLADISATTLGSSRSRHGAPRKDRRARAAGRRSARGGTGLPRRRRVAVELGAVACARSQRADPCSARSTCSRPQARSSRLWSRPSAALDDTAAAGFHDNPSSISGALPGG